MDGAPSSFEAAAELDLVARSVAQGRSAAVRPPPPPARVTARVVGIESAANAQGAGHPPAVLAEASRDSRVRDVLTAAGSPGVECGALDRECLALEPAP